MKPRVIRVTGLVVLVPADGAYGYPLEQIREDLPDMVRLDDLVELTIEEITEQ
jgi:hypothetical protein